MSKFSNFITSIARTIKSSFTLLKPYKRIVLPKSRVIHLIALRNRKILVFIRDYYGIINKIYTYDYEDNYSSPKKVELGLLNLYIMIIFRVHLN